ncbi:hypothetical protein EOD08_17805 [Mesorhizobium sp. M6A.T.Ca.TU.002.02.2.1]|nr:hypothetical protein EOD08_17805 [Mesorhizobium sp. M6A.T.Ca.TU.002.02.2.1]
MVLTLVYTERVGTHFVRLTAAPRPATNCATYCATKTCLVSISPMISKAHKGAGASRPHQLYPISYYFIAQFYVSLQFFLELFMQGETLRGMPRADRVV